MTCESEPFGVIISEGDKENEPKIVEYNQSDVEDIMESFDSESSVNLRVQTVIEAIGRLKTIKCLL